MANIRIGIIGNRQREGVAEALTSLLHDLRGKDCHRCAIAEDLRPLVGEPNDHLFCHDPYHLARESDVIFSVGGDGTMLGAARAIVRAHPEAKLIGVNLGKLGFIAENPPEHIERLVEALYSGRLKNERRLLLTATAHSESNPKMGTRIKHDDLDRTREGNVVAMAHLLALNDMVIDNFGSTRMLTFEVYVNDALMGIMRADGVIVATPTGSTGYAVSAGGPIIEPTSPVILITPIAPHSLNMRPVIIPQDSIIRITARSEETKQALIVADGQEEVIVDTAAAVLIEASDKTLNLLRLPESGYFDLLRTKMLWGIDPITHRTGRR